MVKIWLKQDNDDEGIVAKALLDSSAIELMMSLKSIKKNKFKTRRLERLIYIRNVDGIFNYEGPIEHTVKVELFFQ